jgi:serine/threonine-protein kinase
MRVGTTIALVLVAGCGSIIGKGDDTNNNNPDAAMGSGSSDAPPFSSGTGPYFTVPMFWNRDVSTAPKASYSGTMIQALRNSGGWGNGDVFQIDFSIDVLTATSATPMRSFTPTADFYSPDCDNVAMPVPTGGNVEGETGSACTGDGDCHLLVHDGDSGMLYEMWRANISGSTFYGGCLAVWNERMTYTDTLRGDQCTSADAAGYPISPLLFTADEVAAGEIKHAIRFILPNDRVKKGYTRPATHGTNTTGGTNSPAYGVHLRLRADYPIDSLPSAGAKVVAKALQKYGMYHADGGNIALTAQSDRWTTAKWNGMLDPQDLAALKVEDFDVIDHGSMITLTNNCSR